MKANKKFVEETEAVSAVIGVILMVAITVAIAATVYVYVTGLTSSPSEGGESASATVTDDGLQHIKVLLTGVGDNYDDTNGYTDFNINVNGEDAVLITTNFMTGDPILIGDVGAALAVWSEGETVADGTYSVTVTVIDSVIYDGTIKIN